MFLVFIASFCVISVTVGNEVVICYLATVIHSPVVMSIVAPPLSYVHILLSVFLFPLLLLLIILFCCVISVVTVAI